MVYTNREKLTCYSILGDNDKVSLDKLSSVLMERPSNVIYCEKEGKLYGVISMGDIYRAYKAGKGFVTVNNRFTCVKTNEYMCAKQIFKDNDRINALPVLNNLNELIGDYSRWDDLLTSNTFDQLKVNRYTTRYMCEGGLRICLVRPCKDFVKKQEIMQKCKAFLEQTDIWVQIINREEIMDTIDLVDYIVFTDEDELRGTGTLYEAILGKAFNWDKARTCNTIGDTIIEDEILEALLSNVIHSGVHALSMGCEYNEGEYWRRLGKEIDDKYSRIGKEKVGITVYEELRTDFFAELYNEEYVKQILSHDYVITYTDGVGKLKDVDEKTYKVRDGERRTSAQPSDFRRCIYFYGPCFIVGRYVADNHTIESFLQARLNAEGYKVKCFNYGCWVDVWGQFNRMLSTELKKGDIVIFFDWHRKWKGVRNINMADICEKHNVPAAWMLESPLHCNHKINNIYADEIFEAIESILKEDVEGKESVEMRKDFITLSYIDRYFCDFKKIFSCINGSIVMNCNPFTLGHRYLIEKALEQVDHLIIFVVEEDRSLFSFKERFAMVVEGTKDLKNVMVVPSGNFILSQNTFPEYFLKIEDEDIYHNVEQDITLFAEQIAPKLNITYRFVGEEPEDRVTNTYNEAMKRILPKYDINVVEIPRMKINKKIISASSVREKLMREESEEINKFIPRTTRKILNMSWE